MLPSTPQSPTPAPGPVAGPRRVFLIGNPNCGKTSLFNVLTGERQHVGNWPGITVARLEGRLRDSDPPIPVVDLPGAYSLSPMTPEEGVVPAILDEASRGLLVAVIDASALERNLFLLLQLRELGFRPVVALNCMDALRDCGATLDIPLLARRLGCPVFPTVARTGAGVDALRLALFDPALSTFGAPPVGDPGLPAAWAQALDDVLANVAPPGTRATPPSPQDRLTALQRLVEVRSPAPPRGLEPGTTGGGNGRPPEAAGDPATGSPTALAAIRERLAAALSNPPVSPVTPAPADRHEVGSAPLPPRMAARNVSFAHRKGADRTAAGPTLTAAPSPSITPDSAPTSEPVAEPVSASTSEPVTEPVSASASEPLAEPSSTPSSPSFSTPSPTPSFTPFPAPAITSTAAVGSTTAPAAIPPAGPAPARGTAVDVMELPCQLAADRYRRISRLLDGCHRPPAHPTDPLTARLDAVLAHPWWGLPLLALMMAVVFWSTFAVGAIPAGWISQGLEWLKGLVGERLAAGLLRDLVVDGLLAGVGGVLVFLPNVVILFFWLALLEDSGYLARAAFLMDWFMQRMGLHGRAFVPLLMGFGCNVPAVLATRIIEHPWQRRLTMLLLPLVSCSARLPVLVLLCATFFPTWPGGMLFLVYALNILTVFLVGRFARTLGGPTETGLFLLEMPPYRWPTWRSMRGFLWDKIWHFMEKAGTVILLGSVVVWFMTAFPRNVPLTRDYDAEIARLESSLPPAPPIPGSTPSRSEWPASAVPPADGLTAATRRPGAMPPWPIPTTRPTVGSLPDQPTSLPAFRSTPIPAPSPEPVPVAEPAPPPAPGPNPAWAVQPASTREASHDPAAGPARTGAPDTTPHFHPTPPASVAWTREAIREERGRLARLRDQEILAGRWMSRLGRALHPLVAPLGFGWREAVSLIPGFLAKESIISTLAVLYGPVGGELGPAMQREGMTPLAAFAFMLFTLLYVPCLATLGVIWRESGSWLVPTLALVFPAVLAWIVGFVVFQSGPVLAGWSATGASTAELVVIVSIVALSLFLLGRRAWAELREGRCASCPARQACGQALKDSGGSCEKAPGRTVEHP